MSRHLLGPARAVPPQLLIGGWVNFTGGASPTINGSFNVASVVQNATGDHTITWTSAFSSDGGYPVAALCRSDTDTTSGECVMQGANTATTCRVLTLDSGAAVVDPVVCCVVAWRKNG